MVAKVANTIKGKCRQSALVDTVDRLMDRTSGTYH